MRHWLFIKMSPQTPAGRFGRNQINKQGMKWKLPKSQKKKGACWFAVEASLLPKRRKAPAKQLINHTSYFKKNGGGGQGKYMFIHAADFPTVFPRKLASMLSRFLSSKTSSTH